MTLSMHERTVEFVRLYWSDRDDAPKHERLRRAFAQSINDGFWPAGARLPTETQLVDLTPCSLGTVQRALRALSNSGLIDRRRGSGSAVAELGAQLADPLHIRYFRSDALDRTDDEGYLSVETWVIDRSIISETGRWSAPLGQRGAQVLKIDRIFRIDQRISVYSEFYAMAAQFPDLAHSPASSLHGVNFKTTLMKAHRVPMHRVHQAMRFAVPQTHIAGHIGNDPAVVAPVLNVVALDPGGTPTYFQDFHLPLIESELDLGFTTRW